MPPWLAQICSAAKWGGGWGLGFFRVLRVHLRLGGVPAVAVPGDGWQWGGEGPGAVGCPLPVTLF